MEHLKFSLHFSFFLVAFCAFLFGQGYLFLMYSIAMVLHELAHYFVAKKLFFQCTKMQLSAFGAVLYGEFSDAKGKSQTYIALAGPIANLSLALVSTAFWWIIPESYYFTLEFCEANLGMALINLIPAYPLDGGKVLLGLLQSKMDDHKSIKIVKSLTVAVSLLIFSIFAVALFWEVKLFNLGLFAIFLLSGILIDNDGKNYKRMSFTVNHKRRLMIGMEKKTLIFNKNATFDKVICRMYGSSLYCLEVVDKNLKTVELFSVDELNYLLTSCPPNTKLDQLKKYLP